MLKVILIQDVFPRLEEYPNIKLDYLNEITQLPSARELSFFTARSNGGFRISVWVVTYEI